MTVTNQPQKLFWLPLLAGVLPLLATHAGYCWAASLGYMDWCNLYWDSCTSVSKVGRQLPVTLLFRGGIIPAATLMALFWWLARPWLLALGRVDGKRLRAITWLGIIGALFLIQYCVALGEEPRLYRLFRYTGVMFGVGCSLAAQVLFVLELRRCPSAPAAITRWLRLILWGYVLVGVLSQGAKLLLLDAVDQRMVRDAFEWWLFLLMNSWMIVCGILWHRMQSRSIVGNTE